MSQRVLTITLRQADHLAMVVHQATGAQVAAQAALAAAREAQGRASEVLAAILRGHDVTEDARLVKLDQDQLTVSLPDPAPEGPKDAA